MAESKQERPKGVQLLVTVILAHMAKHPELCIGFLIIVTSILTNYGSSIKQKNVLAPPKDPKRFFPLGSPVLDFPYGDLNIVSDMLVDEEFIIVMYYAPWCEDSMRARAEFQKASKVLLNKVPFVAVNCWWPQGVCKTHYKFYRFPEIYVYHTTIDGFRYTGPVLAEYIVRFIEDLLYPLTPLYTVDMIMKFVSKQDNSLIGFFDFNASPQPPGLSQFYFASMRLIERNTLQPIRCGFTSQQFLAEELGMSDYKQIVMVRTFNTSVLFPEMANFTSSSIQKWASIHQQQPIVKWLYFPGHKSLELSLEIEKGPSLLVFAPVNHFYRTNYYLNMIQEIGLLYHHCGDAAYVEYFLKQSIKDRAEFKEIYSKEQNMCKSNYDLGTEFSYPDRNCCISLIGSDRSQNKNSVQKICEFCRYMKDKLSPITPKPCNLRLSSFVPEDTFTGSVQTPFCFNSLENYNSNEYRTLCCKECKIDLSFKSCASTSFRQSNDPFVFESQRTFRNYRCRRLTLQKSQNALKPSMFINDFKKNFLPGNFIGLSCESNRTLRLYMVENSLSSALIEKLHLPKAESPQVPSVIIIDKMNEANYILREKFSRKSLAYFIKNYTDSELVRHLRTEPPKHVCDSGDLHMCVQEVTSSTFQAIVMRNSKDVVLLVSAQWCGFCSSFSHTYLQLAKYFSTAKDLLFARIDADKNDLPWEFTLEKYPTILFFPAGRKSDSVVFPENVAKTMTNLIKFILSHSTHDIKTDTIVDVCSQKCVNHNKRQVIHILTNLRARQKNVRRRISNLHDIRARGGSVAKGALKVLWDSNRRLQVKIWNAQILQKLLSSHQTGRLSQTTLRKHFVKVMDVPSKQKTPLYHHHDEL